MSPLSRFSVLPYQIDPFQLGGKYLLDHQQAHWDMTQNLPSYPPGVGTTSGPGGTTIVPTGALALASDPILIAPDLENKWSIFANMIAHQDAMTVYPLPEDLTYPFW
jgi:hypothetical protein